MANTRIKDLTNTAVTVPSDAYVAIDGSANGTAKISRDDLRQDTADAIAAAPSTYNLAPLTSGSVDVDKGGTGSTTLAGAKTSLEIPNVGTAANEVPVNGMLGDLAFQSSAAVTVDDLTVDGELIAAVGKPMPVNGPTMRFDGVDDHVAFAAPVGSAFSFTNSTDDTPFTVASWVKMEDATSGTILSKFGSSSSTREYRLFVDASDLLTFDLRDASANSASVYANTAMTGYENQWVHVAATYAGSGPNSATAFASAADAMSLYINGKSVALTKTNNASYYGMSNTAGAVDIGRRYGADYVEGQIRDAKLFNKELSAAEVKEVYSNGQLPNSFSESTGGADVVTDGGFENWTTTTDLTNWSEGSAVSVAQSTDKISGTYSVKLTGGGDIGSSGNNWLSQAGLVFNANKKYRLSGRVKRFSGSTNTLQFGARYYKIIQFNGTDFFPASTSSLLPFIGAVTSKSLGNGWYSFSIDFTTTVGNTLSLGVNGSTDPYLLDDVGVTQIGSVLDARAEQFDTSTGKLYDLSGNSFVGTQSGGVSLLGRKFPVYETGTWTPSITFGGASVGTAYTYREGVYTRVGDEVTLHGIISLLNKGSSTGNFGIEGLPFVPAGGTYASYNSGSIGYVANMSAGGMTTQPMFFASSSNSLSFFKFGGATVTHTDTANNLALRFSITYQIQ